MDLPSPPTTVPGRGGGGANGAAGASPGPGPGPGRGAGTGTGTGTGTGAGSGSDDGASRRAAAPPDPNLDADSDADLDPVADTGGGKPEPRITLEDQVRDEQVRRRDRARAVDFSASANDVVELYRHARRTHLQYERAKFAHEWGHAYYLLHVYLELCLKYGLHKKTEERYKKEALKVRENLERMETRMDLAKKGMLWQRQNAERAKAEAAAAAERAKEEAAAAAAAAAPPPLLAPSTGAGAVTLPPGMTLEEARLAVDALRLGGAGADVIPALAVSATQPTVVGTVVADAAAGAGAADGVPPPLPPKPRAAQAQPSSPEMERRGGAMSKQSGLDTDAVTSMTLFKVRGDGSCAFRAIAQGRAKGKLKPDQETAQADELRKLAVRLLVARGDEEMVGSGMTIKQVVLMKDSYASFDAYCSAMSRSDYAGETEFWLLATALNMRISVFTYTDDGLEHMITYGTNHDVQPVCLLWQRGQASEMGNHYDLLLPDA